MFFLLWVGFYDRKVVVFLLLECLPSEPITLKDLLTVGVFCVLCPHQHPSRWKNTVCQSHGTFADCFCPVAESKKTATRNGPFEHARHLFFGDVSPTSVGDAIHDQFRFVFWSVYNSMFANVLLCCWFHITSWQPLQRTQMLLECILMWVSPAHPTTTKKVSHKFD